MEAFQVIVDNAAVVEVSNFDLAVWYWECFEEEIEGQLANYNGCWIERVEANPGLWTHCCGDCGSYWHDGIEVDSPTCPICGSALVDGVAQN